MTHSIKEKLEELAAARGCRDPLSINIWNEDPVGEVRSEPGLFVPISYRRADNGRRLQGQIGGDKCTQTQEDGRRPATLLETAMAAPMSDPASDIPLIIQWANFYADRGFSVIPTAVGEKRPGLPWEVWQKERPDKNQIFLWLTGLYQSSGIGLVTGAVSGNIFVVDADAGAGKEGIENLDDVLMMHDDFPDTWQARSGGGGRHYFFRAPPGVRIRNGSNVLAVHVDVRGEGGFLVLPPSPHPSGRLYEWVAGMDPATTEIADAPGWLLAIVRDDDERVELEPSDEGEFNAFRRRIDKREEFMRDLLWARMIEERRQCPLPLEPVTLERILADCWSVFERKCKARTGSLASDGRGIDEMRRKLRRTAKKWDTKIADEAKKPKQEGKWEEYSKDYPPGQDKGGTEPPTPSRPFSVTPAFPIDPASIPTRPWLIPGLLIRNHVSVLVAPPGVGKSLLTLQIALMLGTGQRWAGWEPKKAFRVLVINSEDDTDEMRRRLVASARVMGVDQATLSDRLYLAESPETIVIAKTDAKSKAVIRQPLVDKIIETVKSLQIDCVIVDPFAETFEGDENSNSELKWAAVIWREVARKANCSVLLVHHTRKYAQDMAGNADAARGAGALVGVARVVDTLFPMQEEEATLFNIPFDQRHRYVRLDSAKANLSLVTFAAKWFEKRSEPVGNGGDDVGVLKPWSSPGLMDGISSSTINRCLDLIETGVLGEDGRPTGALWSPARQAARWVGNVLVQCLGCDEARAGKIVRTWLTSGLLVEEEFYDGKQTRKGLKVTPSKRPGVAV